jgi:hypothetical protein
MNEEGRIDPFLSVFIGAGANRLEGCLGWQCSVCAPRKSASRKL